MTGSSHIKQATRKGVSADGDLREGANDQDRKYCQICKVDVKKSKWAQHRQSTKHLTRKDIVSYQAALTEVEKDKNGIVITGNLNFGIINLTKTEETAMRPIALKATGGNVHAELIEWKLVSSRANSDTTFSVALEGNNQIISSETSIKLLVTLKQTFIGRYKGRLEMSFRDLQSRKEFLISRPVRVVIGDKEDHERLKSSKPYTPRSVAPQKAEREIIEGVKPPPLTSIPYVKKLKPALIPKKLRNAISDGSTAKIIEEIRSGFLPKRLNSQTFARHFKTLLWVEEHRAQQDLERYDIPDARLRKGGPFYFVEVPGLAEKRPSVLLGDRILVQPHGAREGLWFEGYVHIIREKEVGLRFNKKLFRTSEQYYVRFKLCRVNLMRQHHALDRKNQEDRILFPTFAHVSRGSSTSKRKLSYYDQNIAINPQQSLAVDSIVKLPPGSPPFIVFGPFGTGKTSTIIEAILQIIASNAEARILACAPSNAAADLIVTKLSATLDNQVLFRYNAPSRIHSKDISAEVLKYSHMVQSSDEHPSHFGVPTMDKMTSFRVIVSTCISASFADGIGIPRGHFTHIFIDEAGQATEPEALVSIGTLTDAKTNIILAGDPKQLGPVVQSSVARQLGLQKSYLERLMEREAYNTANSKYNGVTVVKLLNNYRCHPAILKFPNDHFYNGELKAKASAEIVDKYLGSLILPDSKFPIVFHAVFGKDDREASSPSFFNIDEVSLVKHYVKSLQADSKCKTSAEDIGIITPYHAQCLKIQKALSGIAQEIKVGSVEEFQGQERPVIIISTVRSSAEFTEYDIRHTLGFVANAPRLNVAITRSQALLIIIGDHRVLSMDPLWRSFLNYVYNNGGWTGPLPDWDTNDEVDFSGSYDKVIRQQAQSDMNEFTLRMRSLMMDDGASMHSGEE